MQAEYWWIAFITLKYLSCYLFPRRKSTEYAEIAVHLLPSINRWDNRCNINIGDNFESASW